ncbi:MAG: hypothetical protein C4B58_15305 [Deltaproteobacteria bacterium]|nr:MAG: hypothetical protein C4B58_15305 [Deltaproteobacteria bacterium]
MANIIQRKNYLFGIFLFFMILCASGSKVFAQTEVSIESLNSSLFPFIYSHVSVKSYGNSVTDLTRNDFQVFENNNLQAEYFELDFGHF